LQQRWIIHIDMDAFFAAVEQRDNADYRGKPVIVGGIGRRGVVSTASYEARKFGVHSAMPMAEARRLCPDGIYLPTDHGKYQKVSAELHKILAQYSPLIEPLSLDEAFLDVSGMGLLYNHPGEIAAQVKHKIKAELSLVASAGVAPNKFLAKIASDLCKPDGLLIVEPGTEQDFLHPLPLERLWGVGDTTIRLLNVAGFRTIGQLASANLPIFAKYFGNNAEKMRALTVGKDSRPVINEQVVKSMSNEITFEHDLTRPEEIKLNLMALSQKVGRRLRQASLAGRTVTVKIRLASFKTMTRSRTIEEATCVDDKIFELAQDLAREVASDQGIRLIGINVTNLRNWAVQPTLFEEPQTKRLNILQAVDSLKDKFGEEAVTKACLLTELPPK